MRRRRSYLPGFLATLLWLLPTMALAAFTGFFLARDVFSPKFLQPSKVQTDKPHPIRILSPEDAARLSRDEDSHVWSEGVKSSDIPKIETERVYRDDEVSSKDKRSTRHRTSRRTTEKTETAKSSEKPDSGTTDTPDAPDTGSTDAAPQPEAPQEQPTVDD